MDGFISLWSGIRWQDILDILLNAYILFRFYVLFRGTNVIRVLLLLCALWMMSRIAVPLGLVITSWAMQGVITAAAFVIIIVFRNEISSVVQTRDLKSFFWGIPRYQFHTPIDMISDSVFELASQKIGALIVMPLKKSIENVVQGGVDVSANLSGEMLRTLFWPNSPLHDGAVVIEGERITQAGAILPLSKRTDLPGKLGTRHRAGLGLSELTDAMVIVVSEERGQVALCNENQIINIAHKSELQQILSEKTLERPQKSSRMHEGVELFIAGFISLVFITGIWINFSKGVETLADYTVPVEFMMPDQQMEIVDSSSSSVEILLSGTRPLINSISADQINVKMDLSAAAPGKNQFTLTQDNVFFPPGVRLKNISPGDLTVTLDKRRENSLPLQPHWIGKLPEGLVMVEATANPANLKVIGGAMALKDIGTLFTEPILLDHLTASGTVSASIVFESALIEPVGSGKVQIKYEILSKKVKVENEK